jgi:DNA-nicking Smr family endonuclease
MIMKETESFYQFFRHLADIVKEQRTFVREERVEALPCVPAVPEREPTEEDAFLDAMKGVQRMEADKMRIPGPAKDARSVALRTAHSPEMGEVLKESYRFNVVNLPEYMEGYVDDVSPLVMDKLRKGEFSVQKVLDLHGLSADDAHDAFRSFIGDAVQSQICCVRVIHGRGLKSRSGPVLKEKLKEWIVRAMHRKWVVAFSSSKMSDGGPGATTILLRNRAHKKKLHIIG